MKSKELVWIDTAGEMIVLTVKQHNMLKPLLWHLGYKCMGEV